MKVLVTGASGLLGSVLLPALRLAGWQVGCLVRTGGAVEVGAISWDAETGRIDSEALGRFGTMDALVHLAGENIAAGCWTAARKDRIRRSRVEVTARLVDGLLKLEPLPKCFVGASAVGFYGDRGDELLTERSAQGTGFLPEVAAAWEAAAAPLAGTGVRVAHLTRVRVAHLRFGMILSRDGGALGRMLPIFRLGLGGKLGDGQQWVSWISRTDAVRSILWVLANEAAQGAYNAAAPQPVRNAEFTRELGKALHRPALLPAPAFALRLAFGEMADALLLSSQRAMPQRLEREGFQFKHPALAGALAGELKG